MSHSVPDVGVIIPAHNAEATIARAVISALAEPECREVVVIVDGATDGTVAAAQAADDGSRRLKVIALAQSGGPAAARNLALAESRAPWVCPLDADDYFLPGRLGRMRSETGYCDFVADDLLRVMEDRTNCAPHPMIGERMKLPACLSFEAFVLANISRPSLPRAELGFLKPLMRRNFLESHHLAYDPELRLGEDFVLYATALALGAKFKILPPCGYVAVERASSISGSHGAAELRALVEASRRMEAVLHLSPDERQALREHRAHVADKLALREFLDAKRAAGLRGAAAVLAKRPAAAPYIVSTIASDVIRRATPRPAVTRPAAA
jgi:succinoglycan biosynthesis protein ExoU